MLREEVKRPKTQLTECLLKLGSAPLDEESILRLGFGTPGIKFHLSKACERERDLVHVLPLD